VSDEPEAQEARLRYLLSQGAKEGLVAHPGEWPGANSVRALMEDLPVEGYWFDRSQEYFARRRREDFERLRYATREALALLPIPGWKTLEPGERRERVKSMIEEIVAHHRAVRQGREPLGRELIFRQRPHERPMKSKRSPAPAFHAASREVHRALRAAYRAFVRAYRGAARLLRSGEVGVPFPVGCFPPALPFVSG
jgi:hypothetical protein